MKGAGAHDEHTGLEPMSQRDVIRLLVYPFTSLLVFRVARLLLHGFTRLLVYPFTSFLVYRIARLLLHGFTCLLVYLFTRLLVPLPSPFIHPLNFNLMLTYHVIRRKNIKTGDILFYPQLVTAAADDRSKIIERIEKKCTLASADVKAVVDALEVEIIDCLQQGRSIRLGDLGQRPRGELLPPRQKEEG